MSESAQMQEPKTIEGEIAADSTALTDGKPFVQVNATRVIQKEQRQTEVIRRRAKGESVLDIAESLHVCKQTIYNDIEEIQKEYETGVLKTPAVRILVTMLMELDEEQRAVQLKIDTCTDITKTISAVDPMTGQPTPVEMHFPDPNVVKYHQHKLAVIKAKHDLYTRFVLPKDAEGLLKNAQSMAGAEEARTQEQRTDVEIIADIEKLLQHGRRLTYALPPAKKQ